MIKSVQPAVDLIGCLLCACVTALCTVVTGCVVIVAICTLLCAEKNLARLALASLLPECCMSFLMA